MISEVKKQDNIIRVRAKTLSVNAYIIENHDHLTVIDSLLLPSDSKKLLAIAESLKKPIKYLINTHYHSDHCLGNRYLKSSSTTQINHSNYWNTIIKERVMINPHKKKSIDRNRLTRADITIDEYIKIEDIEIISTPGHTPDSLTIYGKEKNYMFCGDTSIGTIDDSYALPYFYWGSCRQLIKSLQKLSCLEPEIIYSGHGFSFGKPKILSDLKYLQNLLSAFRDLFTPGIDLATITAMISIKECLEIKKEILLPAVHKLNIKRLMQEFE